MTRRAAQLFIAACLGSAATSGWLLVVLQRDLARTGWTGERVDRVTRPARDAPFA